MTENENSPSPNMAGGMDLNDPNVTSGAVHMNPVTGQVAVQFSSGDMGTNQVLCAHMVMALAERCNAMQQHIVMLEASQVKGILKPGDVGFPGVTGPIRRND